MKGPTGYSWLMGLSAIAFGAWGVLSTIAELIGNYRFSVPPTMGAIMGNAAMTAVGLASVAAWRSLKSVEERLRRIEELQRAPPGEDV